MEDCPICSQKLKISNNFGTHYYLECPRCGSFQIATTAIPVLNSLKKDHPQKFRILASMSGWIYRNQNYLIIPDDIREQFQKLRFPKFQEKTDILLLELEKKTEFFGQVIDVNIDDPEWLAYCYVVNKEELSEIINYLESEGRVSIPSKSLGPVRKVKIAPPGWSHLEKLKELNPESQQCFIAMSFDPAMRDVYESGICQAVTIAGYDPCRIDYREHIDKIDDRIIAEIRRSRFVVADFTGHKGGVYFEAGFALGLGLPVIWTCRRSDIEGLHFDIRQYNCIDWEDTEDLQERLTNRIQAVLGKGR
jgi:hypothetical protein